MYVGSAISSDRLAKLKTQIQSRMIHIIDTLYDKRLPRNIKRNKF